MKEIAAPFCKTRRAFSLVANERTKWIIRLLPEKMRFIHEWLKACLNLVVNSFRREEISKKKMMTSFFLRIRVSVLVRNTYTISLPFRDIRVVVFRYQRPELTWKISWRCYALNYTFSTPESKPREQVKESCAKMTTIVTRKRSRRRSRTTGPMRRAPSFKPWREDSSCLSSWWHGSRR